MFQKLFLIVGTLIILCCCGGKSKTIFTDEIVVDNKYKSREDTVLQDSVSHVLYSRLYRPNTFGIRTQFHVPEEFQGKKLYVIVSGRSRTNFGQSNAVVVVVTHSRKNEQLSWDLIQMRYQYTEINKWCTFRDSLMLPPNFYGSEYNLITIMAHLPQGNEKFDLDRMNVAIIEKP